MFLLLDYVIIIVKVCMLTQIDLLKLTIEPERRKLLLWVALG